MERLVPLAHDDAVLATAFAAFFWRFGPKTILALWLIVASHFVLDTLIQGATMYPGAPYRPQIPLVFTTYAPLIQRALTVKFLATFVAVEWHARTLTWRTAGACVVIIALSLR